PAVCRGEGPQESVLAARKDDAGNNRERSGLSRLALRRRRDRRHPLLLAALQIECPDRAASRAEVGLLIVGGAAERDLAARQLVHERRLPDHLAVADVLRE